MDKDVGGARAPNNAKSDVTEGSGTKLGEPLPSYGFTCFSCETVFSVEISGQDYTADTRAAEIAAGEAGWCTGHWNGHGQIVCAECKDAIWQPVNISGHARSRIRDEVIDAAEASSLNNPLTSADTGVSGEPQ